MHDYRGRTAIVVGSVLALLAANPVAARELYVCSHPDGHISTTTFVDGAGERAGVIARMVAAGIVPGGPDCWYMEDTALPPQSRSDPRRPGDGLSQEHRWRRGSGSTVVVDPTILRPHQPEILREIERLLPPSRLAQVLARSVGDNLMRAMRGGNWPLVQALLRQAHTQVGTVQEVLTQAELDEIGRIGDDYEATLR